MAIKIRKKVVQEQKAVEPEVLPPIGEGRQDGDAAAGGSEVKVPGMDDEFLRRSGSAVSWLVEHRRLVILAVAAVVLVSFAIAGVVRHKESVAVAESSVMTDAFVTYSALTDEQAKRDEQARRALAAREGLEGEDAEVLTSSYTVPSEHKRFEAIEGYLASELPKYAGKPVGTTGQLMLAGSAARLGHSDIASQAYAKASASTNADVALFGKIGEADALVENGRYDDAIAGLQKLASSNPALKSYLLMDIARIYEIKGDADKAVESYAEILRDSSNPDSHPAALARLSLLTSDASSYLGQDSAK